MTNPGLELLGLRWLRLIKKETFSNGTKYMFKEARCRFSREVSNAKTPTAPCEWFYRMILLQFER